MMKAMKTLRVYVAAGEGVEDARRAVADVMEMLNRHFRPRGVEFVGAPKGEGDWTIALYWKDFGGMERVAFETVYEKFKKEKKPVIHVFFKEPEERVAEALKAFKEAFAEKYGHFYCHFETADAVRFQLAAQSLSMLPGGVGERDALTVENGEVRLGKEPVAKMENLSFAKLNRKRRNLLEDIAQTETRVAKLEEEATDAPDDADLQEALRDARVKLHDLQEELKQHDGFLFNVAVSFAKATAEETSERTRKAWALFQQGKVQEANKLLDWDVLKESTERNRTLFRAQKEAFEKNLQEYLAKAKIAMADDSMTMTERVDAASRAYDEAIAIAREIQWEDEKLVEVMFDYAYLLAQQNHFQPSIQWYVEVLEIRRRLAAGHLELCERNLAATLNNLALLHYNTQQLEEAEREYAEAVKIVRLLAAGNPEAYEPDVATILNNLAYLHSNTQRLGKAEAEYKEALEVRRRLATRSPEAYEPDMAATLNNLAILHKNTQRLSEAEMEYKEALETYRRLAAEGQEVYVPYVATTQNNLARLHHKTQQLSEAEQEYKEALAIYRRLAAESPEAHEPDVAMTLNNLANLHSDTQRMKEAEAEYKETLDIQRRLAVGSPEAYEPDVAATLNNLAILHSDTQRLKEAEAEYKEALEIQQRLAEGSQEAYVPDVAMTLNNLAILHYRTQQLVEAEAEYKEALEIRRWLADGTPEAYEPDVAVTLNNLAALHSDTQRLEEAEAEYKEALEILRRLAEGNPEAYEPDVASTLNILAVLHSDTERLVEAERESKEALKIWRRLAERNPEAYEPGVAVTLDNLAALHSGTQRCAEAEAEYKEALESRRRQVEGSPETYEPALPGTVSLSIGSTLGACCGLVPSIFAGVTESAIASASRSLGKLTEKVTGKAKKRPGSREHEKTRKKAEGQNRTGVRFDRVDFSAIAPKSLTAEEYSTIQIAMYEKKCRKIVEGLIALADAPVKEIRSGESDVARGSRIRITLVSPDIELDDSEEEGEWNGGYKVFAFMVRLPNGFPKPQVRFVATVYLQDVAVTKLKFVVSCRASRKVRPEVERLDIHSAFISYASEDRGRVIRFVQGMQKVRPDLDVFLDVARLRSGEDWEKRLYSEIGDRDVLYLCWSRYAKQSEWVDREWRYAFRTKGIAGIEPVPLEAPDTCPPPNELSRLHFNDWLQYLAQASNEATGDGL